jgi:hypothetical protein
MILVMGVMDSEESVECVQTTRTLYCCSPPTVFAITERAACDSYFVALGVLALE